MNPMIEIAPNITDTEQDRAQMLKDMREFSLMGRADDDFTAVPAEDADTNNELFEESASVFTIDGKDKTFTYVSSFKKDAELYSFAQDGLGLWWWFKRTGITSGKDLHGPYRSKEKLLAAMENIHAY